MRRGMGKEEEKKNKLTRSRKRELERKGRRGKNKKIPRGGASKN